MVGVGGGDMASCQEAAPRLVDSDGEENEGLSDNDEEADQETVE